MYTPQEQKDAIKAAIDLTNDFPLETIEKTVELPNCITNISARPEILYQVIADVSFKLYVIHHTKTDKDFYKLRDYCFILDMLKSLYYGEYRKNVSAVVCQIKYAYPLIGDDPVLRDFVKALSDILESRAFHVGVFFVYAMKITNYLAGGALTMQKFFEALVMQRAKFAENQDSWVYRGPIFRACAAEIRPDFTIDQKGEIFSKYFYNQRTRDNLEAQLRKHGKWNPKKGENDSAAKTRIRKAQFKEFNAWMKRMENANIDFEKQIIESLEKTFWNKKAHEQILLPFVNQMTKLNCSAKDVDEYLNQLQNLSKGLKVD